MSTRLLWDVRQGRETSSRLPLGTAPERATEETTILSATHAKAAGRKQPSLFECQHRGCGSWSWGTRGEARWGERGESGTRR